MNYQRITKLQKDFGYDNMQASINNGQCWKFEGSVGRSAMRLLESGCCMLPKEAKFDYYGNRVPSRYDLKAGTKGTFKNSQNFWMTVEITGEIPD